MKRVMYLTLIGVLAIVLAACSSDDESQEEGGSDTQATNEESVDQEEMQEKLENQKVEADKTVAVVNSTEIKGQDYNALLMESQSRYQQMGQDPTSEEAAGQLKNQVIDSLVGNELVLQAAEENGYEASEKEIEKQIEEVKSQFEDEKQFEKALETSEMTVEDLQEDASDSIKYNSYVEEEITVDEVSEEEAEDYYNQLSEQGNSEEIPEYEEVKDKIMSQLQSQKQQTKVREEVEKLKEDAEVEILLG